MSNLIYGLQQPFSEKIQPVELRATILFVKGQYEIYLPI